MEQAATVSAPAGVNVNSIYIALAAIVVVFAALVVLIGFPFLILAVDAAALLSVAMLALIASGKR